MRALWLGALLLTGCVHAAPQEPALAFPERPTLHFFAQTGAVCLSVPDSNLLARWMHKLYDEPDGFLAARDRLLKAQ